MRQYKKSEMQVRDIDSIFPNLQVFFAEMW